MLPQIKIYSVFHKEAPVPAADYVIPIFAGASQPTISKGIKDNTGENIADLNGSFAELTACYWIWKNLDKTGIDAWGLCHYRRYFTFPYNKYFFKKKSRRNFNLTQQNIDAIVSNEMYLKLQELLVTHDVILQRPEWALNKGGKKYSIKETYAKAHHLSDWELIIEVIIKKYPEYKRSILIFEEQQKMSYYNMMVTRWEIWDHYLEWLFDILNDVHEKIEFKSDTYQQRVFGFLSERLLNLYVLHHKLRPAYLTIALFEK
jgi:hypothetical protein